MRLAALLIAILAAGCTGANELTTSFHIENASDAPWTLSVALHKQAGVQLTTFEVDVAPGETATKNIGVPDRDSILVSVATDGKALGASSYSPNDCTDSPFRIIIRASSGVAIVGRSC